MLEQELRGIINYVWEAAGKPNYYLNEVLKGFEPPAIYFPRPIIKTHGDTFNSYRVRYLWYIKFFGDTDGGKKPGIASTEAYDMAFDVLTAIRRNRNWIPTGDDFIWMRDPELRVVEPSVAQLTLSWDLRRPFSKKEYDKAQKIYINQEVKHG